MKRVENAKVINANFGKQNPFSTFIKLFFIVDLYTTISQFDSFWFTKDTYIFRTF